MESDSVTQSAPVAPVEALPPDIEDVISRRVDEKMAAVLAAVKLVGGGLGSSGEGAMAELLQSFAENMAAISAQANHKQVVSPAVKRTRDAGYQRMVELIVAAKARGEPARYKLKATIQLNTNRGPVLVEPAWRDDKTKRAEPTIIEWPNAPCDAMQPDNDLAREIYAAFLQSNTNVEGIGTREDAIGITAKGRIVFGSAVHRRELIREDKDDADTGDMQFDGANIVQGGSMHQKQVRKHVLGTTAAPFIESGDV